jgi:DNA polymerase III epsilon subunit-like protein
MLPDWPSIIQLGYIIYDIEEPNKSKIFNKYIDIPDNIVIPESSIAIHHIDREKIRQEPAEKRALIADVIREFMNDIMNPEIVTIVAHNAQFDRKFVIAELLRMKSITNDSDINTETEKQLQFLMNNKNFTCSMDVTTHICNIQIAVNYKDKKTGEDKVFYKVKGPKLIESYQYYFGYSPHGEALHDALIDVILTLRVFMKYKYNEDVCGKNEIITEYIKKISPEGYVCNLNKIPAEVDIENIKLEIVDPFDETETITTNSDTTIKTKSKSKKGGNKNKKRKAKTKRRRSKRIAMMNNSQKK